MSRKCYLDLLKKDQPFSIAHVNIHIFKTSFPNLQSARGLGPVAPHYGLSNPTSHGPTQKGKKELLPAYYIQIP